MTSATAWRWGVSELICKSVKDLIWIDYKMSKKMLWVMGPRRIL